VQQPAESERTRAWPLAAAGPVAAVGATALSWVLFSLPVFAVWLAAESTDLTWDQVVAIAGQVWLAAQGMPVVIFDVTISWLPWGLGMLIAALLYLAGRWAVRVSAAVRPTEVLVIAVGGAVVYAGLATAVATWIVPATGGPGRVLIVSGVLASLAMGAGAVSGARLWPQIRASIPVPLRRVLASATVALGTWIMVASLALGIALVLTSSDAHRLVAALDPDIAGVVALTIITIGYLPSAIMWAVSYLVGTGFTVVDAGVVSPFSGPVTMDGAGALPGLPLFGVIPGVASPFLQAAPVIGLVAGVLGGLVLRRRGAHGWSILGEAALAVAVACGGLFALLLASSGSLGDGRLAAVGPNLGATLGVACVLWTVGYLIVVGPAALGRIWDDAHDDDGYPRDDHKMHAPRDHTRHRATDRLLTAGARPGSGREEEA
jgi:hypothetical protein